MSSCLYLVLFFCAPLIAKFYNEPFLTNLTRWIALVFVINSFGLVQNTILVIQMNFKRQSVIKITGLAVSIVLSVILAILGWGVYSIVAQVLIQGIVTNLLFWFYSSWRPVGKFNKTSFKKLWKYGSNILISNLFTQLIQNIDNLLIGKIFKPYTLGLFIRAKSTKAIPESIFMQAFQTSVFPILTKLNDNPSEFNKKHMLFFKLGIYFIFPLIIIFYYTSNELVDILYGEKWLSSVKYLKIIMFATIPVFLGALFNQTVLSFGDSKLFMKLNMIKRILGVINIPIAIFWGLIPYLISIVILSFIGLVIDIFYTANKIKTNVFDYFVDVIKTLLFLSVFVVPMYLSEHVVFMNVYLLKTIVVVTAIGLYIGLVKIFAAEILNYYIEIFKSFLKKT